jgi:hypothetical protein
MMVTTIILLWENSGKTHLLPVSVGVFQVVQDKSVS